MHPEDMKALQMLQSVPFIDKVCRKVMKVGYERILKGENLANMEHTILEICVEYRVCIDIKILDYEEHALQSGSNSQAAAYIHLLDSDTGHVTYGVGVSSNITRASVRAIFSAINRLGLGEKNKG